MKNKIDILLILIVSVICGVSCIQKTTYDHEVVILGEGTGAVSAAIQSARSGASTLLINPLPWLGGMTTSAGVSAIDGNNMMPAGLWGEWRQLIHDHYGGPDSVATGWVSNTLYEPHIGEKYWRQLVEAEENLIVWDTTNWENIKQHNEYWEINLPDGRLINTKIIIDGTDLGDAAAAVGVNYKVGMDARNESSEGMAPAQANDIIQDLTYAAILKDYGKNSVRTIPQPANYTPNEFHCACQKDCDDPDVHSCETMLTYAKLPNGKYMINWPINGNDYYTNVVSVSKDQRVIEYENAKQKTLRFIYYIQTELGYEHLGLADDEFPTNDLLPLMPYHREGRRIVGEVQTTINHILDPYATNQYRTGIAVGDYPIDHHHYERTDAPKIEFPPVPSFNIPLGSLVPAKVDNLIMADKAISVSNIANGSTRLQPVIIQIGQAAGLLAAKSIEYRQKPREVSIRSIQAEILSAGGYLMPYYDVKRSEQEFKAIQKIGACGILRGEGRPYKWANQTWFYPDSIVDSRALAATLKKFEPSLGDFKFKDISLRNEEFKILLEAWASIYRLDIKGQLSTQLKGNGFISRREFAKIVNELIDPFSNKEIDMNGNFSQD